MKQKLLYTLMFSSTIGLIACAGGGGGSGVNNPGQGGGGPVNSPGNSVPYYTPTKVGTVNAYASPNTTNAIMYPYAENLTGSGAENLVIAGRESQPFTTANHANSLISIFGWENGTLVDQTSKWFAPGTNIISGTEPDLLFTSLNKNGRLDMIVPPSTDASNPGPLTVYWNEGSNFTQYVVPTPNSIWAGGATTYDLFNHGRQDIITTDYGPNFSIFVNNGNRTFTQVVQNPIGQQLWSSGTVAVADFLNNGTSTIVTSDSCGGTVECEGAVTTSRPNGGRANQLWSWSISGGYLNLNQLGILPDPVFTQPQWASYKFGTGNTGQLQTQVALTQTMVAYDFIGDGLPGLLMVTRPNLTNNQWPDMSALQFIKNNGNGVFTDVTSSTLVGWNYNTPAATNIQFIDLFNNGLQDIILSGQDFNGNPNTTILLKTSDGKYVTTYQNILTALNQQVSALQNGNATDNSGNVINIIKGPNNNLYFITTAQYTENNTQKQAVYMSLIGNSTANIVTANSLLSNIKAQWPWMSSSQANAILSATSTNYLNIGEVLNPDAVLNPNGGLWVNNKPISGYIAGLNIGDTQITAFDQLGRNFNINMGITHVNSYSNSFNMNGEHIDQHELTSHTEYLINGSVNTYGPLRVGSETRNIGNTVGSDVGQGPVVGAQPKNYTVGIPRYWTSQDGHWSAGAQYTTLNYNPWMAFGGSWGQITQTGNLDHTIRYNNNGWTAVAGTIYTTTNMTPGLITNVAPIVGAWGETGYRFTRDSSVGDLGIYAGVKPTILSGNVQANLPTSVDNNGNTVYTKRTLGIQNQSAGYVRALWTTDLQKNVNYRLSGTAMTNGQYRLMNELRFNFD